MAQFTRMVRNVSAGGEDKEQLVASANVIKRHLIERQQSVTDELAPEDEFVGLASAARLASGLSQHGLLHRMRGTTNAVPH